MTLLNGLFDLPWWGYVLYTLIITQITIAAVTLYLHRSQAHLSVDLHPMVAHFFRFWLWLTTGMSTMEWVAVHRKHHAKCETADDPHSPRYFGLRKVLFQGAELYRKEADNAETLSKYSHGVPNDWLERKIYYGPLRRLAGVSLLLPLQFLLFGFIGVTIWAIQMMWIPFHGAGGINGIGHYWGYRNYESPDDSTNMTPWAFWIGGEELHNNHHAYPSSARFSIKPWEFDIGWMYIRILRALGLAKVKKTAPKPVIDAAKQNRNIDMETLRAVIRSKMHVMADYAKCVIKPVLKEEQAQGKAVFRQARKALTRESSRMNDGDRVHLQHALDGSLELRKVYQFRQQLLEIWERTYGTQEKLLQALRDWCQRAEQSGIHALHEFAARLKGYSLKTA